MNDINKVYSRRAGKSQLIRVTEDATTAFTIWSKISGSLLSGKSRKDILHVKVRPTYTATPGATPSSQTNHVAIDRCPDATPGSSSLWVKYAAGEGVDEPTLDIMDHTFYSSSAVVLDVEVFYE